MTASPSAWVKANPRTPSRSCATCAFMREKRGMREWVAEAFAEIKETPGGPTFRDLYTYVKRRWRDYPWGCSAFLRHLRGCIDGKPRAS